MEIQFIERFNVNNLYYYDICKIEPTTETRYFLRPTLVLYRSNINFRTPKNDIDPHKNDIIKKIAEICKRENITYQSHHNHIPPYNGFESKYIEDQVNNILNNNIKYKTVKILQQLKKLCYD